MGKLVGPTFEKQLRHGVQLDQTGFHSVEGSARSGLNKAATLFPTYRVILDADVDAIANPLAEVEGSTDPSQPNATICVWSARRRRWVQSDRRLACANDSDTDYSTDDAAWAIPQAGVYFLGGCPQPVANRATAPWLVTAQESASNPTPSPVQEGSQTV